MCFRSVFIIRTDIYHFLILTVLNFISFKKTLNLIDIKQKERVDISLDKTKT